MQITPYIAKLTLLAAGFCSVAQAAIIFNFDNDAAFTATPFTDTVGGLSATFSAPGSLIQLSFFDTLTGNVLANPASNPLTITFSSDITAIDLLFVTADFTTPSPFTLTAYEGNTQVGTNTLPGAFISGFQFPEGEIAFDGATFNNVVLSTPAQGFAIDDVLVIGATAPEPAYAWILGFAFIALGAARRTRNSN